MPAASRRSPSPSRAVRFTILAAPGSDPGEARSRATTVIPVDGPAAVAAAAATATDPYVLLLAPGARPVAGAFSGLAAALEAQPGVVGGATCAGGVRHFGWMLAPERVGPLRFALVPIAAGISEAGIDAAVRGPIDVVAPGMLLARRELVLRRLPADPVAALVELSARARETGRDVVCRPGFACEAPIAGADDRGRLAALRALADARPELDGAFRLPLGMRRRAIERMIRLPGGRRARTRIAVPPLTVLVHGDGAAAAADRMRRLHPAVVASRAAADPAAALHSELRVRGDRYVLVAAADRLPDADGLDRLIAAIEETCWVALAAPDAGALDGACVLIAPGRFPQHVEAEGATIAAALESLIASAGALRRAVRAPGYVQPAPPPPPPRTAAAIVLASSLPEIARMSLDAVLTGLRPGEDATAALGAHARTMARLLAAYPQVRVETDPADPLLTGALNRTLGAARADLLFVVADDVLLASGTFERLRSAFDRIPGLGAAFPAVPGAPGGEGILDAGYADLAQMRAGAEGRARARAREAEPIDLAVTPAFAVARDALVAVGGIDPAFGPTRRGIADLVLRLRAAGYGVVRCDDALVHRFDAAQSQNPAAAADAGLSPPPPPAAAAIARGFDPAKRVPFVAASAAGVPAGSATHAIVLPIATADELERAAGFVAAAAAAFDASAPVRIHLLLDGDVPPAQAAARLRPVLAARGLPLESAVAVRVERVDDLAVWRDGLDGRTRLVTAAGFARPALADFPAVSAAALRGLLDPVSA